MTKKKPKTKAKPPPKKTREGWPKAMVVLHVAPDCTNQQQLALFMVASSYAYSTAQSMQEAGPEYVPTWPIHLVVESGGVKMCGTVEPSNPAMTATEPAIRLDLH